MSLRLISLMLIVWVAQAAVSAPTAIQRLAFEPNAGQIDSNIEFLARARGYSVAISSNEAVIHAGSARVRLQFVNSQPVVLEGLNRQAGVVNSLLGNDPKRWLRGIPTYAQVRGRNLYPGVDVLFHGNENQLEFDLDVAPGADATGIALRFGGAQKVRLNAEGDIVLDTSAGELRQKRPVIYQERNGQRDLVEGHYRLAGDGQVRLEIARYDHARALVIDPELVYAVQLGGTGDDRVKSIATDRLGNIYIAGLTDSVDFPLKNAFQGQLTGHHEVFVTKLDPTGQNIVYSTYIGGTVSDAATGIAVDPLGNAYVTGVTNSPDFPTTPGVVNESPTGVFMLRLNPAGDRLGYSAIVAGSLSQSAGIAVDRVGGAYITGTTEGDVPVTPGAYDTTPPPIDPTSTFPINSADAFVLKLNGSGGLSYATYAGQTHEYSPPLSPLILPIANAIAVDGSGSAYIAGWSFIMKFNATGSGLVYSANVGRSDGDAANAIAVDSQGNAYAAGETVDAHAFVSKFDATGQVIFNTSSGFQSLLSGEGVDAAQGVAVNSAGNIFVAGYTSSRGFPQRSPVQEMFSPTGTNSGFLAELDSSAHLLFSTYVGDTRAFEVTGLALDPSGQPVFCGNTYLTAPVTTWVARYDTSNVPALQLNALNNLATGLATPASPGEVVTISGAGYGTDVQLFFGDVAATLVPNSNALTAIVPYALADQNVALAHLESGGASSNTVQIPIAPASPAIFTVNGAGTGEAIAFNQDGTPNSQAAPAQVGSVVTFYATGSGQTVPPGVDGVVNRRTPASPALPYSAFIGYTAAASAQFTVGPAPGFPADVLKVQATVPPPVVTANGAAALWIVENGVQSQTGVTIWISQ